ncbi:MAG: sugar phosphate nucleotidyltransferase [Candidatus Margulisiibacteriota bacterium]
MGRLAVIVLAAGKGVRMKSDLPKVFHKILGEPMLSYVLTAVKKITPERIFVVVGHQRQLIMDYYKDWPVTFVIQEEQLGTGHAVMQVESYLNDFSGNVLVLAGDVPLISENTLRRLVSFHEEKRAAVTDLSAILENPGSYGRVIRAEDGVLVKIVEKKDASPEELKVKEINTGIFCFEKNALFLALKEVRADNAQKEYYLTDTVEILKKKGYAAYAFCMDNPLEALGVNTKEELIEVEKILIGKSPFEPSKMEQGG